MDKSSLDKIIALIRRDAEDRRTGAEFSGRWDDGGAECLLDQIKFFNYGRSGTIPHEWEKYRVQAQKEADGEYQDYLRLKDKFEK